MVSRIYRHLSLFLVVLIATSWFVLPYNMTTVRAAETLSSDGLMGGSGTAASTTSTGGFLDVATDLYKLTTGYQFAYTNNPNKPTSIEFSWNQPNGETMPQVSIPWPYIRHYRIDYLPKSQAATMDTVHCNGNTGWTALRPVTVLEMNEQRPRTVRTFDNGRTQIREDSYFRLLAVFGSTASIDPPVVLACGTKTITPYVTGAKVGVAAGGVAAPNQGERSAATYFSTLTNSSNTSLTAGNGDIDLIDDPKDETGDTNKDKSPDPVKPPILRINKARLVGMPAHLDLTLVSVIRAPEILKFRNNNYFIFSPSQATAAQKKVLTDQGINPDLLFFAVDVGGNIGILLEDKSKNGGLFASGKDRLDPGDENNFVAMGRFNARSTTESKNANGQPFNVNIDQYRKIITKRVYNDQSSQLPATARLLPTDCTTVTNYPSLNTTYDSLNPSIPFDTHRQCINVSPGGWLMKWGVQDNEINQSDSKDPCEAAFSQGLFSKLLGSVICGVIHAAIAWSTWIALFAVNFMIEAIGLQ